MRNFLRWGTIGSLAVAAVSLLAIYFGAVSVAAQIGLCLAIGMLLILATCLQATLDQGHDHLSDLIAEAEGKLAERPADADKDARALLDEARAQRKAAEDAPVTHVHAGAEIDHIGTGIQKARQALALLDGSKN